MPMVGAQRSCSEPLGETFIDIAIICSE